MQRTDAIQLLFICSELRKIDTLIMFHVLNGSVFCAFRNKLDNILASEGSALAGEREEQSPDLISQ